ncbi:MAG: PhoH family protein [Candidatus Sumerlaeia bacterium]|nr:PhoH family protein [Candidatus Sumerlaeia bacterium]
MQQTEQVLTLNQHQLLDFCGNNDEKIRLLQSYLDAKVVIRGNKLKICGLETDVHLAEEVINELLETQRNTGPLKSQEFRQAVRLCTERFRYELLQKPAPYAPTPSGYPSTASTHRHSPEPNPTLDLEFPGEESRRPQNPRATPTPESGLPRASEILGNSISVPMKKAQVKTLTASQKGYVEAIRNNVVTFGIGPAGTGKTYLAMAMAASYLKENLVRRIVLCRPAVEAGERLGFLPGDLAQKFDPYVRPLWDALYEMMDAEQIKRAIDSGIIEVAPLAYMRGRTLSNAFVILDEGQNTTVEQMKMFLTRLGFDSKAVITGDITQIDLPKGVESGLRHAQRVLQQIEGVGMVHFHRTEVVRHPLLTKIIHAYEIDAEKKQWNGARGNDSRASFNTEHRPANGNGNGVSPEIKIENPPVGANGG